MGVVDLDEALGVAPLDIVLDVVDLGVVDLIGRTKIVKLF